jgi:hypothetical protein
MGYCLLSCSSISFPTFFVMPSRSLPAGSRPAFKTDILMSIRPIHMERISTRKKTREFRSYLLPASVTIIWFYTSAPVQKLRYVADISAGKKPGEIAANDTGIGNQEFNDGKKREGMYAYEILKLWEVRMESKGITLRKLKEEGWMAQGPTAEVYVGKGRHGASARWR